MSEERYRLALESSTDGLWDWDIQSDTVFYSDRFREDLWYRLNIFPITVPPLRKRSEDIPLLVEYFVDIIAKRLGKSIENIPTTVMDALRNYHWPGNIREPLIISHKKPKNRVIYDHRSYMTLFVYDPATPRPVHA
jgi:hypothetical protein